ncbi:MAG: LytR/AlgR family response regulator transcription factor [Bacteroidota bacterium]
MKVILIDDEPLARSIIKNYCERIPSIDIIGECENGFDAVKMIDDKKPDLIFLDVQMPKLNGFEVLELIQHETKVIFTTAFDEYAVKAFDSNAIDYLLKPFLFDRFEQAIEKCSSASTPSFSDISGESYINPNEKQRIVIKDGENINIIPLHELIYIEAYDDYVKLFTEAGRFVKKQTMVHYEKTLPENAFIRIHRSSIIAIDRIHKIENAEKGRYQVLLTNGVRLPISRNALPELKSRLGW